MSSEPLGIGTSSAEISGTAHGVWLLTGERELFMPYEHFPWFKDVPFGKNLNVEEPTPGHFYWPELDADLGIDSIEHPERYPLKSSTDA